MGELSMSGGISAAMSIASPPVPAPQGVVAFVVASVRGSTKLWDRDPEAMSEALRLYVALLKRLVVEHGGYEIRAETDSFMVAFHDSMTAARWSLDVQETLLAAEWPDELLETEEAGEQTDEHGDIVFRGLRVGMGVHLGEPSVQIDERSRRVEYEGPPLDWTRLVAKSAHGGQILLTSECWQSIEDTGVHLLDSDVAELGPHRFPGREQPVELVQLLPWRVCARTFPEVQATPKLRTNLPVSPGYFFGRDRLLSAVERLFKRGRRVVTLKGHGGIGKTRLSLRYGGLHAHEYAQDGGGVWFCDLAEARSIDGIVYAVGRAMGLSLRARSMKATNQLGLALASRGKCLLILDNFEHLERYAEYTIALWVRKAPQLRLLVTSRHKLGLNNEAVVEIMPLDTDDAAQLFEQKALSVRPELEFNEDDHAHVLDILTRVECVPLAIEMAAAWLTLLSVEGVAERLKQGMEELSTVVLDDVPKRHATLHNVMAWSWDVLAPYEQEALLSVSVFRGGFTGDAVAKVVSLSRFRSAPNVQKVLLALRDKSMVYTYEADGLPGQVRWGLFDSVRDFAESKLASSGLRPTVERRHANHYLVQCRKYVADLHGPEGSRAMADLALESDNLLAVHHRFTARQPQTSIQAALMLDPVLSTRGPFQLHTDVLKAAVESASVIRGGLQIPVRMTYVEALLARGRLLEAAEVVSDSFELLGHADSEEIKSWVGCVNGWILHLTGKGGDGLNALKAGLNVLSTTKDHVHTPTATLRMGAMHLDIGDVETA
ncbi:MAG: putative ATPase/class 3 adenylate cyclase, partial [Kiritimatiellia bacterium]